MDILETKMRDQVVAEETAAILERELRRTNARAGMPLLISLRTPNGTRPSLFLVKLAGTPPFTQVCSCEHVGAYVSVSAECFFTNFDDFGNEEKSGNGNLTLFASTILNTLENATEIEEATGCVRCSGDVHDTTLLEVRAGLSRIQNYCVRRGQKAIDFFNIARRKILPKESRLRKEILERDSKIRINTALAIDSIWSNLVRDCKQVRDAMFSSGDINLQAQNVALAILNSPMREHLLAAIVVLKENMLTAKSLDMHKNSTILSIICKPGTELHPKELIHWIDAVLDELDWLLLDRS